VVSLKIHLPNAQQVRFIQGEEREALQAATDKPTQLEAFFIYCAENPQNASNLTYCDIVKRHLLDGKTGFWRERISAPSKPVLGRIQHVPISIGELFFLKMLLLHRKGPTNFDDLRTVDNITHPTFKKSCEALGLIQHDTVWETTLNDLAQYCTSSQLRKTFAIMAVNCEIGYIEELWLKFKHDMIADFVLHYQLTQPFHDPQQFEASATNSALLEIQQLVEKGNRTMASVGLREPTPPPHNTVENQIQQDYQRDQQQILNNSQYNFYNTTNLNAEQARIFNSVISTINQKNRNQMNVIFITGPGGCGKTLLSNTIVRYCYQNNKKICTAAWSGIASTLLIKGQTVHKTFNLSIHFERQQSCNVAPDSKLGIFLQQQDVFIIDEVSMMPLKAWKQLDGMFKDLNNNWGTPMGGQFFILTGDFAQRLPIVSHASKGNIIQQSLPSWEHWPQVRNLEIS